MAQPSAGGLAPVTFDVVVRRQSTTQPLGMCIGPRCEVKQVAPGSPAAAAGVFAGTTVRRVNGVAVATREAAKAAGAAARDLRVTVEAAAGGWVCGRVAGWRADKGFGYITPDVPLALPAGTLLGEGETSVFIGDVFFHASACAGGAWVPEADMAVACTVRCVEGRLRAVAVRRVKQQQQQQRAATVPTQPKGAAVEFFNVNNLHEISKIVFRAGREPGTVQYWKNGTARPAVRRVVFDGDCTLSMPEIGKKVQVPAARRAELLHALRELTASAGAMHDIPAVLEAVSGLTAQVPADDGECERAGGDVVPCRGRVDGAMVDATTDYLWLGWLDPGLGQRSGRVLEDVVAADVCEFLVGHRVRAVRPLVRGGRVAALVTLAAPITQAQFAELNMRLYRRRYRISVDDAQSGNAYAAQRRRVREGQRVDGARAVFDVVVDAAGRCGGDVGLTLDAACRVARVEEGGPAATAGLYAGLRVVGVGGTAVETCDAAAERMAACAAAGSRVAVTVDATSEERVVGTVESWCTERRAGSITPARPVFVGPGVLCKGQRAGAVYIGDVACTAADIAECGGVRVASLAVGQEVEFTVKAQRTRLVAADVTSVGRRGALRVCEATAGRGARVGADMERLAGRGASICMRHLGGACGAAAECGRGVHIAKRLRPAATGDLGAILTRVSAAKLELLRGQCANAAAKGGAFRVEEAWQLNNPALEFRFRATEYNFMRRDGRAPDMIDGFHGSAHENILSIATHGFDPLRRCGQAFGAGEYFAKSPHVSVGYCRGGGFMFLCKLILGEPDEDHTWVSGCEYYVMKQRDAHIQCLPTYLVRFKETKKLDAAGKALAKTLRAFGGEADGAEDVFRRAGEGMRGGAAACKGRVDAAMMAASTRHLWVGWLDPVLGKDEAALRGSVEGFLRGYDLAMVKAERNGARVGAFVELAQPVTQLQVAALNVRPYVDTHGRARRISVDDAQPGNPMLALRRCPRLTGPGKFCRGWNLRGHADWTEACSFRHDAGDFPLCGAELRYEDVPREGAKWNELAGQVEGAGVGRVTRIRRVVNTAQEAAYESRRSFVTAMHGFASEKELWHGTACSVLDTILAGGLRCPADSVAADACPVSGGKGLATTLCGTECVHCVEPHRWGRCHMFGMGIYLADSAFKSHRYVRPHAGRHQLVRCRVNLGSPYLIEAHLRTQDAMHDHVRCVDPTAKIEANAHVWDTMQGHESYFVKGLGHKARSGFGVINDEYIVFHPAQVLPLYVVDYEPGW